MKNASVYSLLSVTSLACAIAACDAPEEPEITDVVVRQLCNTPTEGGQIVSVHLDSGSEWDEDSLTIMTEEDLPFVVRDDGLEGDAMAGDEIFTASPTSVRTIGEGQCAAVDMGRPGELQDRLAYVECRVKFVEDGAYSAECGSVCDDWLGWGCLCFYDCTAGIEL